MSTGIGPVDLANTAIAMATQYLLGLSGVYYLLDVDPEDPASPIEVRDEWVKPAEVGGTFVGANLTFDGRLVMITDEGWIVVARDFTGYEAIQLVGADAAPRHLSLIHISEPTRRTPISYAV